MRVASILVAAGTGSRFGARTPKQFLPLGGIPVIRHAALHLIDESEFLQPVGPVAAIDAALAGLSYLPPIPGGTTRQESVCAGLEAVAPYAPDVVLIHDAARPVIPGGTVAALLDALQNHAGAIPALPVSDTLKRANTDGVIAETVSRDRLYRAQTPQAFRFPELLALHRAAAGSAATDDAAILEQAGYEVALVAGSDANVKITFPEDLARMETYLLTPRIGTGYDVHAFIQGRSLWLCGIEVPFHLGLAGHSDADVGLHALCDAIYGALAEGDIGRHFPPSEAEWRDADSSIFVRHAASRIAARGGRLANVDITLLCEQPKIAPYAPAMIGRVAGLLGVEATQVSIKATTTEQLGFTGRGEGIAAQASALVLLP